MGLVLGWPGLINGVPRRPGDELGKQGIRDWEDSDGEGWVRQAWEWGLRRGWI